MAFLDLSTLNEILVTGGAGFAGSHVVDCLLDACPQAHIRILDAMGPHQVIGTASPVRQGDRITFFRGDLSNPEIVGRASAGVDLIVNLAAETSVDRAFAHPANVHASMVVGVQVLADAMRHHAVPLMVHVSSASVYGRSAVDACDESVALRPLHPLAAAKAAAEMVIRSQQDAYGLDIRILRPVTLTGTRQGNGKMLGRFIESAIMRQPLTIHGSGAQRRCFLDISDFCSALLAVLERGAPSAIYNVGSSDEHSVIEMAETVLRSTPLSDVGYVVIRDRPAQDMRRIVASDALAALGWSPRRTLADTLPDMVDWRMQCLSPHRRPRLAVVPPLAPVLGGSDSLHDSSRRRPVGQA